MADASKKPKKSEKDKKEKKDDTEKKVGDMPRPRPRSERRQREGGQGSVRHAAATRGWDAAAVMGNVQLPCPCLDGAWHAHVEAGLSAGRCTLPPPTPAIGRKRCAVGHALRTGLPG